jgi:uncharacterized protein (DUF433 family)
MDYGAITIQADIMHGAPVFKNTKIAIQTFFEYLEDGRSLEKFLNDFPSVNKKDVIEVLQMAKFALTTEKILSDNFTS